MDTQTPTPFQGSDFQLNASLKIIFEEELNSLLCALKHLRRNLPEMAELAAFKNLKLTFEEMLEETLLQIERIEDIFDRFAIDQSEDACLGTKCIIDEAYEAIKLTGQESYRRDMALIFYVQIIDHIEIACYDILRSIAKTLGYEEADYFLTTSLDEAKDTRKLLQLITEEYVTKKR